MPSPYTFQFVVTAAGTPEQLSLKRRATTIAFNENTPNADTITDSGNGLLIAGFQPGDTITVSSTSGLNDGTYTILSVAAGTITLLPGNDLATETAGAAGTVKITAPKPVSDGIAVTVKAIYANGGTIRIADSSAKALNTTTGGFGLRNNESVSLQVSNISDIWLDATVSGEGVEVIFERNLQT